MILSRSFMDYCITGWDNLPRKLLMYFSNVAYPLESYFQTVLCNSPEFHNTSTIDTELRYTCTLLDSNSSHTCNYHEMVTTGGEAVFARPFKEGDWVLQEIDKNILNRSVEGVVPGEWCLGRRKMMNKTSGCKDFCSALGDINTVEPSSRGLKLGHILSKLAKEKKSTTDYCHGYIEKVEEEK